ncbi:MAG TPA: nicotinate-nucleotide adenylyltransferase [Pyrinomonadaceae bacterium]|nr:nicotinate-nucleotide adenylyltransferase [Pyrinomonadaceae bacterium]
MEKARRIAVYGGSFDPVHRGHLTVARELCRLFRLDEFRFLPAHVAPHKRDARVTPALHRYAMLALATQDEARWLVSTLELDAPERPYTIETLSALGAELNAGATPARLFFVMGADSWLEITTWREWKRVLSASDHIVVTRPGSELHTNHVTPPIRERIVDLRGANPEQLARAVEEGAGDDDGKQIYFTDAVLLDISSTNVRRAVRHGQMAELKAALPGSVAGYIEKYGLYQDGKETRVTHVERNSEH